MWILGAALTTIHIQCFLFTRQTSKTSENLMVVWNKNLVFSSSGHSWSLWIWQNIVVLLFPVGHQFPVFWLSVLTVSIKSLPTYCLYFCFPFTFFLHWIAQQASSLCVWLIPLAHTPSPSAAVHWKGEGTAIDHFFPHTCTHTPYLQRHYRSTGLMFFCGEELSFPFLSFYICSPPLADIMINHRAEM